MRNLTMGGLVGLLACAFHVSAQPTTAFTYQGKLTDSGSPANGSFDMEFRLFDTPTVGTGSQQGVPLQRDPVTPSAGVFTVTLDFGANVFSGADRFLEIGVRPSGSINAYTFLSPRQQITSSPYAIQTLAASQQPPAIPTGAIILWDSTPDCPAGYTAVTGSVVGNTPLDNYYLRATTGAASGTVSGAASVSPSLSATSLGAVGSTDLAHTHSVDGTVAAGGLHTHSFTTGLQQGLSAFRESSTGPFTVTGDHTHAGTTASAGSHTHAFSATSGGASANMSHSHSVSVSTTGSVTVGLAPLGYGVLLCRKN
jgi:hypothetical protein